MRVQLGEVSLAYDAEGQGRPLLLIHGYPLNRSIWEPQLTGLDQDGWILAPDLRGHGDSEAVPGVYSMDLLADDCNAFLQALGVNEPVVVCGLSMGGYITLAFNRRHPDRVAGLILAGTRAGADSPEGKLQRDAAADLAREKGTEAIAASLLPKMLAPESYTSREDLVARVHTIMASTSLEGILGDLMGMKDRPDSTTGLGDIAKPTLILHGADDQIISPEEARGMHREIKHSRLEILPGAGHLLNLEQPVLFNQAVREFLESLPA